MSENTNTSNQHDAGLTLVELVVTVMIMGLLATVISASVVVTLRTSQSNDGRLNVARAEQNIAVWMPADLSSAVDASQNPSDTPCGAAVCGGVSGSNALQLSWPSESNPGSNVTVAYIYRQEPDTDLFELFRVRCEGGSCVSNAILHSLEGPENFVPGVTPVPDDVIDVTVPLVAGATVDSSANLDTGSSARRIVVTVNGGGMSVGGGGGVNRVSITAGGTTLSTIEPTKVTGPSFTQARSRCGGPITIIVDDSGSIRNSGGAADTENAVRGFVSALAGTPTSVQIIKFSSQASTIGTSGWTKYYDMTSAADVEELVGPSGDSGRIGSELNQNGGTNWEDAVFRTFYDSAGTRLDDDGLPTTYVPGLVVFFTDGEPTRNRTSGDNYRGEDDAGDELTVPAEPALYDRTYWPTANGRVFDQEGFDRTSELLSPFRNTDAVRLIGVGVGGISTAEVKSFTDPTLDTDYRHRYHTDGSNVDHLQRRPISSGGSWSIEDYGGDVVPTPAVKVLGNLVAGGALTAPDDKPYVVSNYDNATNEWTDAEIADMFITSDFDKLPSALSTIAVGQCGGTLTLQTSLGGSPAPSDVTYEIEGETVTTSQVNRAATFDLTIAGGAPVSKAVTPQSFEESGYVPQSWNCRSKGEDVPSGPATWSPVDPGDAGQGINVTVAANQALSCTLTVAPS